MSTRNGTPIDDGPRPKKPRTADVRGTVAEHPRLFERTPICELCTRNAYAMTKQPHTFHVDRVLVVRVTAASPDSFRGLFRVHAFCHGTSDVFEVEDLLNDDEVANLVAFRRRT